MVQEPETSDLCHTELDLATTAYNNEWVISEQIRLLKKYLTDDYTHSVYDNSSVAAIAWDIKQLCVATGTRYVRVPGPTEGHAAKHKLRLHERSLIHACAEFMNRQAPVIGFLDHDIFPTRETSLLDLIRPQGFFGVGQRNPQNGSTYLWPGFCFFERDWLRGRYPDFRGRPSVDTGAGLSDLITQTEVDCLPPVQYGHLPVEGRPNDGIPQSWAVEQIGDWIHFSNTCGWLKIRDPLGRELSLRRMLMEL